MISGGHAIIYTTNAEADRAFLRDVLGLPYVDSGDGWLIFALPPSEIAFHPGSRNDLHEFFFMCDDVQGLVRSLRRRDVACTDPEDHGWGILMHVTLPGGGKVGIYEPRHARPQAMGARRPARKPARRKAARKPAARSKPSKKPAAKKKQQKR